MPLIRDLSRYLGLALINALPVSAETQELQSGKIGAALTFGVIWSWVSTNFDWLLGDFWKTVPVSAVLFFWTSDMILGTIHALRDTAIWHSMKRLSRGDSGKEDVELAKLYVKLKSNEEKCWNGTKAKKGVGKLLFLWVPALILTYAATKSGLIGASIFATALQGYICWIDMGSSFKHLGALAYNKDIQRLGESLEESAPEGLVRFQDQLRLARRQREDIKSKVDDIDAKLDSVVAHTIIASEGQPSRSSIRSDPNFVALEIVIIDDTDDDRELISMIFDLAGHNVRAVGNRVTLLELLTVGPVPDLLVSDLDMGTFTGIEVARMVLDNPRTKGVPCVAMTGHDVRGGFDFSSVYLAGFKTVVGKPMADDHDIFVATCISYAKRKGEIQ